MNKPLKQILLISLCFTMFGNAGCTTIENVHASPEAMTEKKIRVGDKVTVHYATGHSEIMKLTDIGEMSLSGITEDGRRIDADYTDLLSLDHKKVEVLKTAGATVGVVVLGAVVIAGAGIGAAAAVAGGI